MASTYLQATPKVSSVPKTNFLVNDSIRPTSPTGDRIVLGCLMSAALKQTLIWSKRYCQKALFLPPSNSKLQFYTTYPSSVSRTGQDGEQA